MRIIQALVITTFLFALYCFSYNSFFVCLLDDVEFSYGKKKVKNRKKETSFFKKLFFLDIKDKVKKWHYVLFWINFIAFLFTLVAAIVLAEQKTSVAKIFFTAFVMIYIFSEVPVVFSRWELYKGNKIRRRKK